VAPNQQIVIVDRDRDRVRTYLPHRIRRWPVPARPRQEE